MRGGQAVRRRRRRLRALRLHLLGLRGTVLDTGARRMGVHLLSEAEGGRASCGSAASTQGDDVVGCGLVRAASARDRSVIVTKCVKGHHARR
jgi:hypothetical protein